MKLRHSLLPRRAVSLLVSTALCTSLLAFPAHAEVYTTNPDDSLQYDSKTQTFVQRAESTAIKKELERIGKLSTVEEQYSVCSALCEQHPDVPSANYMLAFLMRYSEPDKNKTLQTSVYKGYKRDKIEMRGDRAEISDFPLYLNTVAGGLDCRDQTIGGFSFVVKIYAVPVVEIIG